MPRNTVRYRGSPGARRESTGKAAAMRGPDRSRTASTRRNGAAKIPVLAEGPDTALFGPGFSGGFSPGVDVRVPAEFAERAEDIRSVFDASPIAEGLSNDPRPEEGG